MDSMNKDDEQVILLLSLTSSTYNLISYLSPFKEYIALA